MSRCVRNHAHDPYSVKELGRKSVSNAIKRKAEGVIDERPSKLINKELEEQSAMASELTHRDVTYIRKNIHNTRMKYHCPNEDAMAVNVINTSTIKNEEFL